MRASLAKSLLILSLIATRGLCPGPAQAQPDDRFERAKLDRADTQVLAETPRLLEPAVTFLSQAPEIDGRLDRELATLPVRAFTRVWKSDAGNPDVACHYRLDLPVPGHARMAIFDVAGRRIRSLRDGALSAGRHRFFWDARDDAGPAVASGPYLARASTSAGTSTGWLTILR